MNQAASSGREEWSHLFAGTGLGLLVGTIAGLSISPVVSVILGSLAALLAAFLGLGDAGEGAPDASPEQVRIRAEKRRMKGLRAGSFGIACVIGIATGVYARVVDIFAPSLTEEIQQWIAAGYSPEQARDFTVYERLGIKPKGAEVQFAEVQKRRSGGLFAGDSETEYCFELRIGGNRGDPTEVLKAYGLQDSPTIRTLGAAIAELDLAPPQLRTLLEATVGVLCEFEERRSSR